MLQFLGENSIMFENPSRLWASVWTFGLTKEMITARRWVTTDYVLQFSYKDSRNPPAEVTRHVGGFYYKESTGSVF